MENVTVLTHDEAVRVEGSAIAALQAQIGEAGAEGVLCRAMEEMANRLSYIERCYARQDREAVWKTAKGLIGITEQIGLSCLAEAARAVAACARESDDVALAATLGRLIRLGDRSLTSVWDLPETTTC